MKDEEYLATYDLMENKLEKKYASVWVNSLKSDADLLSRTVQRYTNNNRLPTGATVEVLRHRDSKRKTRYTTNYLLNAIILHAPAKTGYGRMNMLNTIDKTDGKIILGIEGAKNGQKFGAPYMVHINNPDNPYNHGHGDWIQRAIDSCYDYSTTLGKQILDPEFDFGVCTIDIVNGGEV